VTCKSTWQLGIFLVTQLERNIAALKPSFLSKWVRVKVTPPSHRTNKAGEEKDCVGPQSKAIIERDVVVSLEGGDHVVMGVFNKHDNKYFLVEQEDKKKLQEAQNDKTRLHVRKVMFDATLHMYKLEEGDTDCTHKQVKIGDVKSVKGKLQLV